METEIDINKNDFLRKLEANPPAQVSLPVVYAIVDQLNPVLGVSSAKYEKYAELSGTGLRTVARTIPALHQIGLLRKKARRDGPPVLWVPKIMKMKADEAVRRAGWLAGHEDENPQNYFRPEDANEARRELGRPHDPTKMRPRAFANDQDILRLVHSYCDEHGLTPEDPQSLTKAIHALRNSLPKSLRHLDSRGLRKAYLRARARLPDGYDRWIGLIEKWDKSYTRQMARRLPDRLVTAVGNRPSEILDKLFNHLERQICDHWPKKVHRLESECQEMENSTTYMPDLRTLKEDELSNQVYAALGEGKTKKQLCKIFTRSYGSMTGIGQRLRSAGRIKTIRRRGQWLWVCATNTAAPFAPACNAILGALKKGTMNLATLAQETGRPTSTVKSALCQHLLPNGTVIRTKRGIYALADTERSTFLRATQLLRRCKKVLGPFRNSRVMSAPRRCRSPNSLVLCLRKAPSSAPNSASTRYLAARRSTFPHPTQSSPL
jgi:hypothetical protein